MQEREKTDTAGDKCSLSNVQCFRVIIRNIDLKKNKKPELEYDYKPNFSSAVTNIRLYLRKKIKMKVLILRIKKFLVAQRPERSYERNIKGQSCKPLNYRTS